MLGAGVENSQIEIGSNGLLVSTEDSKSDSWCVYYLTNWSQEIHTFTFHKGLFKGQSTSRVRAF
jgi:hypothetical protein